MRDRLKNEGPAMPVPARGARPTGPLDAFWADRVPPRSSRIKTMPVYYDESMTSEHTKFAVYKTAGRTLDTFAKTRVWSVIPESS